VAKPFLSGLVLTVVIFLVITIRNTAVLGNTEAMTSSPSFQAIRLINFGFLTRLDVLFAVGHTVAIFLKCGILFYITVLFMSQILRLKTYHPVIFPLGCIGIILGIITFPSSTANLDITASSLLMVFVLFIFIFPTLSLSIAKLRNLPEKGSL
jgi:spore germination protein KB